MDLFLPVSEKYFGGRLFEYFDSSSRISSFRRVIPELETVDQLYCVSKRPRFKMRVMIYGADRTIYQ